MVGKAFRAGIGVLTGLAMVAVTAPAHAQAPVLLNCTELAPGGGGDGASQFQKLPDDKWAWHFNGIASCGTQLTEGTFNAEFEGVGTSSGLGLCSSDGVINSLTLNVDVTLIRIDTGTVTTRRDVWSASPTTFPETTPFLVSQGGNTIGGGTLFTHIFDHCPPGGTQSTLFQWVQQL